MQRSGWWSPALLVALVAFPYSARADQRRVALAVPDQELAAALAVALSPAECEVVRVDDVVVASEESAIDVNARAAADAYDADAVVWLERLGGGYLLSAYSTVSGRIGGRPLANGPPFGPASAVAVAFSIKTLLREGGVIETPSRRPREEEPIDSEEEADSREVAAVDQAAELDAVLASLPPGPAERVTRRSPLMSQARLWFELGGATRATGVEDERASRVHVGATCWIAGPGRRMGVAVTAARDATLDLERADVRAELSATEVSAGARLRLALTRRLALIPEAGLALRVTGLRVVSLDGAAALSSSRVGAVVEGGLALAVFASPRLAVAFSMRLGFEARPALYTWRGDTVLEEPWTRSVVGLRVILVP